MKKASKKEMTRVSVVKGTNRKTVQLPQLLVHLRYTCMYTCKFCKCKFMWSYYIYIYIYLYGQGCQLHGIHAGLEAKI